MVPTALMHFEGEIWLEGHACLRSCLSFGYQAITTSPVSLSRQSCNARLTGQCSQHSAPDDALQPLESVCRILKNSFDSSSQHRTRHAHSFMLRSSCNGDADDTAGGASPSKGIGLQPLNMVFARQGWLTTCMHFSRHLAPAPRLYGQ